MFCQHSRLFYYGCLGKKAFFYTQDFFTPIPRVSAEQNWKKTGANVPVQIIHSMFVSGQVGTEKATDETLRMNMKDAKMLCTEEICQQLLSHVMWSVSNVRTLIMDMETEVSNKTRASTSAPAHIQGENAALSPPQGFGSSHLDCGCCPWLNSVTGHLKIDRRGVRTGYIGLFWVLMRTHSSYFYSKSVRRLKNTELLIIHSK